MARPGNKLAALSVALESLQPCAGAKFSRLAARGNSTFASRMFTRGTYGREKQEVRQIIAETDRFVLAICDKLCFFVSFDPLTKENSISTL